MTPADQLAAVLERSAGRPLLTYYDDVSGERTELSAATTANWVAKTANLLVDGLGLGPGDVAAVRLPLHWQAVVVLLGCWAAGLDVDAAEPGDPVDGSPAVAVLAEDEAGPPPDPGGAGELLVLSLRPLGAPLRRPVPGALDYAAEVAAYGDAWPLRGGAGGRAAADGAAAAARWGLTPADRLLCLLPPGRPEGLLAGLLAPLAAGAAGVLVARPDPGVLARHAEVERVTVTAGVDLPGLRRVG